MIKKMLLFLMFCIVLCSLAYAYYPGSSYLITSTYTVNGVPTNVTALLTINYPNGTNSITNGTMNSSSPGYFSYVYTFQNNVYGAYYTRIEYYNQSSDIQGSAIESLNSGYYPGMVFIIPAKYSVDGVPTNVTALLTINYPNGTNSITNGTMNSSSPGYFSYVYTFKENVTGIYYMQADFYNQSSHLQGSATDLIDVEPYNNLTTINLTTTDFCQTDSNSTICLFLKQINQTTYHTNITTTQINLTVNHIEEVVISINKSLTMNMTDLFAMINSNNVTYNDKLNYITQNQTFIENYLSTTNQSYTQLLNNILNNNTYWLPLLMNNLTYWAPILNNSVAIALQNQNNTFFAYFTSEGITLQRGNTYSTNLVIRDLFGMKNASVNFSLFKPDYSLLELKNSINVSSGVYEYNYSIPTNADYGTYTVLANVQINSINYTLYSKWSVLPEQTSSSTSGSSSGFYLSIGGYTCEQAFPNRITCLFSNNSLCVEGCPVGYYCDSSYNCQKQALLQYNSNINFLKDQYKKYTAFAYKNFNNKYLTLNYFIKPEFTPLLAIVLVVLLIFIIRWATKSVVYEEDEFTMENEY